MNLLVFGFGYTAQAFARAARDRFARIVGTVRTGDKAARLTPAGVEAHLFPAADLAALRGRIAEADAILVSVPPDDDGDPVLAAFANDIARSRARWIGYLSTVGVYGDHGGMWVDENTPPAPLSLRSRQRLQAELAWLAFGEGGGKAVHLFRLAGIYGPGRNLLRKLAAGDAQRIVKTGQVFNRIHVDDIAAILSASLDRPRPGAIYNVADGRPAPPQEVVAYAAEISGLPAPPEVSFEEADLSPMARSFYGENKRVRSALIRDELGVVLAYPTYREGLSALLEEEGARSTPRAAARAARNDRGSAG